MIKSFITGLSRCNGSRW